MDKEAKETFFNELYQLDEDSGQEEEDQSNASVILRESRLALLGTDVPPRNSSHREIHSSRPEKPTLRTVSAPLPQPLASSSRQPNLVGKISFSSTASSKHSDQVVIDTPVMMKKSAGKTAHKETSKAIGKRKRGQSVEMKPESQQIFKGLAFCRPKYLSNLRNRGY